jgi:predicted transcriptional regulators
MSNGEDIRDARIKSGISQTDLAKKIGVSKQTLYKYEKNIVSGIPESVKLRLNKEIGTNLPVLAIHFETFEEEILNQASLLSREELKSVIERLQERLDKGENI